MSHQRKSRYDEMLIMAMVMVVVLVSLMVKMVMVMVMMVVIYVVDGNDVILSPHPRLASSQYLHHRI
eukprot:8802415-Pyramimonas_sp.AAC.1